MRARHAATLAAAAALAGLAACGTGAPTRDPASLRPPRMPLQAINGPVQAPLATRPLTVRLERRDRLRVAFKRPPRSGLLFDLDTGEVLWRRLPRRILPIASLTKMMTALVATDELRPSDRARITRFVLDYSGSGVGVLPRGKRVNVETLLYGLLLPSGNDAARALAQRTSGTLRGFVARMNDRATRMNLTCTRFAAPDGLKDKGNHSCAADLAAMARAVLDVPRLAKIVRTRQAARPMAIKGGRVYLYNNNPLLRTGYPGTLGIKTGFTNRAGRCLVAAARRGGRRLGVVLLNSPDPGRQAVQLLDRGFRLRAT